MDEDRELPEKDLEDEEAEELPPREAMSVVHGNVAIPVDPELAASILAGDADPVDEEEADEEGAES